MAWGTLLSLNHENREGTFTGYSLLGLSIIIRSVRRVVLHYQERSVCVLAHIALTGAAASQTEDCLCQLEELDVMFAGVVAAAWLTPT